MTVVEFPIPDRWREPHWLYRFFDTSGDLLYIGVTHNPTQRLTTWRHTRGWFADVTSATWQLYADRGTALTAEMHAIRAERPRHNVHHNRPWRRHRKAVA